MSDTKPKCYVCGKTLGPIVCWADDQEHMCCSQECAAKANRDYLKMPNSKEGPKFKLGDLVRKIKGSEWTGAVVGTYSTKRTPEGYCVESCVHRGSVQIYPAEALESMGAEWARHHDLFTKA